MGEPIHGLMLASLVLMWAGFTQFAQWLGAERFSVKLGLVCYGAGAIANVFAALINGFVVEALHANGASEDLLRLCWELNQALAYFGVYVSSAAFAIWGASSLAADWRVFGAAALAAGLAPPALLATGAVDMHVTGAYVVYAIHAAFAVFAGARMLRARL